MKVLFKPCLVKAARKFLRLYLYKGQMKVVSLKGELLFDKW